MRKQNGECSRWREPHGRALGKGWLCSEAAIGKGWTVGHWQPADRSDAELRAAWLLRSVTPPRPSETLLQARICPCSHLITPQGSFWDSPHTALCSTVTWVQPEEPDASKLHFPTRWWQCLCAQPCPGRREHGEHRCGVQSCWTGSPWSPLRRPKASLDAAMIKPSL